MDQVKFGTDGWRAVISDNFTFDNVRRVAEAIAKYFKRKTKGIVKIAVGFDTRFLSKNHLIFT